MPGPAAVAARLRAAGCPGVSVLESGLDIDGLGRFSFVVARPRCVAIAEAGRDLEVVHGPRGVRARAADHPLRAAAELLARLRPARPGARASFPFAGGATLVLGYDLGRRLERLPARARADSSAPDLHLAVYDTVLGFDHARGVVRRLGRLDAGAGLGREEVARAIAEARADARAEAREALDVPPLARRALPAATLDREAYRRAVATARRWIRRGDLFEVNLSRRWTLDDVDPDRCLEALRALSPAPFMADLDLGRGRRLLSTSPERFLRLEPGGAISSWPIKGTRPRGASKAEDAALRAELLASPKEQAELAMIVDLVRNDLGRVARPGSVRVADARRVQSWPTVHHTVGIVEAALERGRDWADLVAAAFPPGSVTGAPKVRALEVIDELEPVRRGLYCGAFGWVGWDGALDLAVAIRIASFEGRRARIHAGGAVLLDSDPAAEERETWTKARALLRAASHARGPARG